MTTNPINTLIVLSVIITLFMLTTSRILVLVRSAAILGVLLGLFPFFIHHGAFSIHTIVLSSLGIIVKGVVIPMLLFRAIRSATNFRETRPHVGFSLSIVCGILITLISFGIGSKIPPSLFLPSETMISLSICITMCGLFLIMARSTALAQVIGYLVLENGIFTFGVSLPTTQSLLVELGILLDLLVGVFVMGIVIHQIHREFDSISTDALEALRE